MKSNYTKHVLAAIIIGAAVSGCHKNEDLSLQADDQPLYINGKDYTTWRFIDEVSRECYYWDEKIPSRLDYTKYDTPYDFFDEGIRYKEDHFSMVVNDYNYTQSYFDNEMKTDGINMELFLEEGENVIAVVNYVYDNTPASNSGLRRGSVIESVDGQRLTVSNFETLLNRQSCTYTYSNASIDENGEISYGNNLKTTAQITKRTCKIDPILASYCDEIGGRKYGYLLYDAFTESTADIMNAIARMQKYEPTDLILDLRLNGGGYVNTLDTLASMLVPDGNEGKTFIETQYNKNFTEYLRATEGPDFAKEKFVSISPKLNLQNLYVLISANSASASEELISGLMPYMNVVTIGENSYGKYTTNILLNNEMNGRDDNGIPYSDWAVYITIGTCVNSLGEMNFKDGFTPDFKVDDPICHQLGDPEEPLLKKALQLISGNLAKSAHPAAGASRTRIASHGKPRITHGAMIKKM